MNKTANLFKIQRFQHHGFTNTIECWVNSTQQTQSQLRSILRTDEVYRLYHEEGLSQSKIGRKLGVGTSTIRRIFVRNGWSIIRTRTFTDAEVRHLYFEKNMTQKEVADKLGTSSRTIRRIFKENGWISISQMQKSAINSDEVFKLYFEEGMSQQQIATRYGFKSSQPIRRIFNENGWKPLLRRYLSEEEYKQLQKARRRKKAQRLKDLRFKLFGNTCKLCGVTSKQRKLFVHKKDGTSHDKEALWRVGFLLELDVNDWVLLCTACHRGTHWLMGTHRMDWSTIHQYATKSANTIPKPRNSLITPDHVTNSIEEYHKLDLQSNQEMRSLRRALFGERCYFCNIHYKKKKIVTHRKDGRPHDNKLLRYRQHLCTLNPIDWVSLCQKCHRYVHWTMDTLHMKWSDLANHSNFHS
ncbi:MAG: helix-turn-helix domain-containing protein [Candidatus Thorarchaeota archaeon]